ncbi:hypothetical protein LOAG_17758 [Loa loa]|uniref:GON-4-like protein n=1 Tax=Loa loa TaxID=7209 RepID=A0A1I7W1R9_LOALO|nr:hypothetical protein LOAG_17758 [Loa loa]EJD75022.1 hypothetical protein LOAG_17758 [Loa loa]
MLANLENPDIANPLDFLKKKPVMFQTFQEFVSETVEVFEGRNAHNEMEEEEPEFNEETEWAPLPEDDDEAENWPSGLKRSRTIRFPVPATQTTLAAAVLEEFHQEDLEDLSEQLQRELEVPQAEPFLVPLWPAATRIYGRVENSSGGASCPRLVPEGMCGREQRKTDKATQTRSCGKRKGCPPALHSRPVIPFGNPHAPNLSLPVPVLHPLSSEGIKRVSKS